MLAGFWLAPTGEFDESDDPRAATGVIGLPRQQHCRLAIPCSGSSSRGPGLPRSAEGVARPHGCGRGNALVANQWAGRALLDPSETRVLGPLLNGPAPPVVAWIGS